MYAYVEYMSSLMIFNVQVCWVYNTYYLPYDEKIPKRGAARNTIGYYQWVSLLLCMMVRVWFCFNVDLHDEILGLANKITEI